jgi:hypothetical protein
LATRELHERIIPDFADSLPLEHSWSQIAATPLVEHLHSRGISVRHLGLVRSHIPRNEPGRLHRRLCLTEMVLLCLNVWCRSGQRDAKKKKHQQVVRMVKNQTRQQLRSAARRCRLPSLELDRRVVLDVLNVVFALTERSLLFWTAPHATVSLSDNEQHAVGGRLVSAKRALLDKFGSHALEPHERRADYDLRADVDTALLVERLQAALHVRLSARTRQVCCLK